MCSINMGNLLVKDIGRLFGNENYSDVVLIVGERRIPAHKLFLSLRSDYFRNCVIVSPAEIKIDEPYTVAFNTVLQSAYTGELELPESIDKVLEILIMATKYSFLDLQKSIIEVFKRILAVPNFLMIYQSADLNSIQGLKDVCYEFADENAKSILVGGQGFEKLQMGAFCDLISREAFGPFQTELYVAVRKWIQSNDQENPNPLLNSIRLTGMPVKFLLQVVRKDEYFKSDDVLAAVAEIQGNVDKQENQPAPDSSAESMESSSLALEHGTPFQESGNEEKPFADSIGHADIPEENMGNSSGQISIKMSTGEVFELEVNSETTVQQVKEKIEERMGVPKDLLDICKPGVGYMSTERTLGSWHVKFGDTLKCIVKKQTGESD